MLEVNWEEPTRVLPTQNYSPSLFSGALDRQQYLWSCHFQQTEMVTVHHTTLLFWEASKGTSLVIFLPVLQAPLAVCKLELCSPLWLSLTYA